MKYEPLQMSGGISSAQSAVLPPDSVRGLKLKHTNCTNWVTCLPVHVSGCRFLHEPRDRAKVNTRVGSGLIPLERADTES